MAYVNLSHMPNPKTEYTVNFQQLNGGLNLSELEHRLKNDESPAMRNLIWREGVLCGRDGQEWVIKDEVPLGEGIAMHERLFWGYLVAHIGDGLYALDTTAEKPEWEELIDFNGSYPRGSFFRFYGKLYYKAPDLYVEVSYDPDIDGLKLSAQDVDGYTPVIQLNSDPETGAGDLYQPENRIQPRKEIWYNAEAGVAVYQLPVAPIDSVVRVVVDGVDLEEGTDYTVDEEAGTITFTTAPPVTSPPTNNTVQITYSLSNHDASDSVMLCPYATTYGGSGNEMCVVMGGCPAQPNAIFWSGSNIAMDATYFPMSQYQLCGDTDDPVTGFGKQQSYLVVFKEHGVGRVKQDTATIDGRLVIDMPYTAINDKIGCDLPYSIQLIDNNLVWCNTEQGVHFLKDSSYAYENNIECVSLKVNGGPGRTGLLNDVRTHGACSLDDSKHYWLCSGDKVWVWDYENTTYKDPSWYYFTNIRAVAFASELDDIWHLNPQGRLTHFARRFRDYDDPIDKSYRFASQFFGGYDRLKNVNSVIIVVRPDTNCTAKLTYITDYETRVDLTNLEHVSWQLVPRDLSYRSLRGIGFGAAFRRRPMCRRVRHFSMQLDNNESGQDLSIVSAQIFYNYQGRLR